MANKKSRASKTSKGTGVGAKRLSPPLSPVEKVLMGKGMLVNIDRRKPA
jgi:hypothetical protein